MPRTAALDQISRQPNGSYVGIWSKYLLRSAYQPIFAFGIGEMQVKAYEGLIRPFYSDEPISPAAFFGSIKTIDRFGIETLTRTLHVLNAPQCIGDDASLFLNFDPSVFVDRAISDAALRDLKLVLHESGIDPGCVVCELTEHKSGSEEALFEFVRALKANGFKIAIDDYGAEDSDFGRVKALQPQIIKFDGAWISRLIGTNPGAALLKAMVTTFHDMGIKCAFEGLEELWQLDVAAQCQADYVQGFVLARPTLVPLNEAMVFPELQAGGIADRGHQPVTQPAVAGRGARAFGRRSPVQ